MVKKKKEFIVDKSNEFAYAVAEIISGNQAGKAYNPAVFFGKSGVGKTHLVEFMEEKLIQAGKKVMVITGEKLIAKYIAALRQNHTDFSTVEFCKQFEVFDALIVEDIQYLEGALSTQEMFVIIANHFFENGKQIVFTMNCKPKKLEVFNEQLLAKFEFGIHVEIHKPTELLKKKIVEKFCEEKVWKICEEQKQLLADAYDTLPGILGTLKQIQFYVEEMNCVPDQELFEKVVRNRKNC